MPQLIAHGCIVPGDIIVAIDSKPVKTANDLLNILENHQASDTVTIDIVRGNDQIRVPVTLQSIP